jgi:hypothetical protein
MFGTLNLELVKGHQDDLRREAAQRRLAAKAIRPSEIKRPGQTRRVFGLRLSLA